MEIPTTNVAADEAPILPAGAVPRLTASERDSHDVSLTRRRFVGGPSRRSR